MSAAMVVVIAGMEAATAATAAMVAAAMTGAAMAGKSPAVSALRCSPVGLLCVRTMCLHCHHALLP